MAERIHPALRRLWNLGSVPTQALETLERPRASGEALAPELDRTERQTAARLAPLLSLPGSAGANAIESALGRYGLAEPAQGTPEEGTLGSAEMPVEERSREARSTERSRQEFADAVARLGALRAEKQARRAVSSEVPGENEDPQAQRRASRFPEPARQLDTQVLERMAGLGADSAGVEGASRRGVSAGRSEPGGAGGGARAGKGARDRWAARGAEARSGSSSGAGGAGPNPEAAPGAGAGEGARSSRNSGFSETGETGEPRPPRVERSPEAVASGRRASRRAVQALSAADARAALARRADRVGASSALRVPVNTEAAGVDQAALLARPQAPRVASRPASSPSSDGTAGLAQALERVMTRKDSRAARSAAFDASTASTPGSASTRAPEDTASRLGGLAGLAARAAAASLPPRAPAPSDDASPPPSLLATSAVPPPAIPTVLAERLEETQLTRRLERILRREAQRAGLDLEGLEP